MADPGTTVMDPLVPALPIDVWAEVLNAAATSRCGDPNKHWGLVPRTQCAV